MILLTASESMERLFDLDMQLVADATGMIIAIFVLYLAMSYFLFEPAKKVLQNRQDRIKNELDEAQTSMEQANALKAEYEEKLKDVEKEKQEILSEARKNALKNESEIIEKAKEEAARIMERAQAEAALEKIKKKYKFRKIYCRHILGCALVCNSLVYADKTRISLSIHRAIADVSFRWSIFERQVVAGSRCGNNN